MSMHRFVTAISTGFVLFLAAMNCMADDQKNSNVTTIKVEDMTCGGCAKKVQQYVSKVSGVEKVEPDVKSHTIKVFPKVNNKVSAKKLWEAVEQAGYTPSELEGAGISTKEKPKS